MRVDPADKDSAWRFLEDPVGTVSCGRMDFASGCHERWMAQSREICNDAGDGYDSIAFPTRFMLKASAHESDRRVRGVVGTRRRRLCSARRLFRGTRPSQYSCSGLAQSLQTPFHYSPGRHPCLLASRFGQQQRDFFEQATHPRTGSPP